MRCVYNLLLVRMITVIFSRSTLLRSPLRHTSQLYNFAPIFRNTQTHTYSFLIRTGIHSQLKQTRIKQSHRTFDSLLFTPTVQLLISSLITLHLPFARIKFWRKKLRVPFASDYSPEIAVFKISPHFLSMSRLSFDFYLNICLQSLLFSSQKCSLFGSLQSQERDNFGNKMSLLNVFLFHLYSNKKRFGSPFPRINSKSIIQRNFFFSLFVGY